MVVAGPSGCGKTMLIVSMITTDLYRRRDGKSVFKRVFVFSPSVHADPAWLPVKKFVREDAQGAREGAVGMGPLRPGRAPASSSRTQREIIAAAKEKKLKKLFNVLMVVDDFADDPSVHAGATQLLHSLFTRGRHALHLDDRRDAEVPGASRRSSASTPRRSSSFGSGPSRSCWPSSRRSRRSSPRTPSSALIRKATEEQYSFLYVDLAARRPDQMFWLRFQSRLVPKVEKPDHHRGALRADSDDGDEQRPATAQG
jgi:hypothetical protein